MNDIEYMNEFVAEYGKIVSANIINIKPSIAVLRDDSYFGVCDKVVIVATENSLQYRPIMQLDCREGDLPIDELYNIYDEISVEKLKRLSRIRNEWSGGDEEYYEKCFESELQECRTFGVKIVE